ncbi:MAG: transporter substrate-binding domain-containing protein [Candidatus Electryonea clarkiae]|nr:transporter substrate-binding domain-containing protein [Candidatus Electryonea clarkiae]MDP8285788.1 transporter substrate-binding domain-containing protein [Candidatus Electryonea clarkiae]
MLSVDDDKKFGQLLGIIAVVFILCICISCSSRKSSNSLPPLVDRDFSSIIASDTLRVITRNHPMTYYIYRGTRRGFDFELINKFAEENHLFIEVIIPPRWVDMTPALYAGEGDIITSMMTVTPQRDSLFAFTRSYLEVWQVMVGTEDQPPPLKLEDLNGREVLVRQGSSYEERLLELQKTGIDVLIRVLPDSLATLEPIQMVAEGKASLTVLDNTIAHLEQQFYPGLVTGVRITNPQSIAWAVRPNAPELKEALDEFLARYYRSAFFNILKKRYFENRGHFLRHRSAQIALTKKGQISRYDSFFQDAAELTGFDWRLLAAQAYHESRFYPDKTSWAGASGVMQLMPKTAESLGVTEIFDPQENILAGARYLKQLYNLYPESGETDRLSLALAAYNVGLGHIDDARKLTVSDDRDKNSWDDVRISLVSLENPAVYRSAVYGFCRGRTTAAYVRDVFNRYDIFKHLVPDSDDAQMLAAQ